MIVAVIFLLILIANFIAVGEFSSPLCRFMANLALTYCGYVLGLVASRDHFRNLFSQEKESQDGQ